MPVIPGVNRIARPLRREVSGIRGGEEATISPICKCIHFDKGDNNVRLIVLVSTTDVVTSAAIDLKKPVLRVIQVLVRYPG